MTPPVRATVPRPSRLLLIGWALLGLGVVMMSYAFVLALAVDCVWVPFWILRRYSTSRWDGPAIVIFAILLAAGIVISGLIVWSLIPRFDRTEKGLGARVTATKQPRLFSEIEAIAVALRQPMPEEVRMLYGATAGVTSQGGFMSIGATRVLYVGLPLLGVLTVAELRAVLAHEFAHYYSGDLGLSRGLVAAEKALESTFAQVNSSSRLTRTLAPLLALPIQLIHLAVVRILSAYWSTMLQMLRWISRHQEFRADELACAVAGSQAQAGALRRVRDAGEAWPLFALAELGPIIDAGARSPIIDGFAKYIAAPAVVTSLAREREDAAKRKRTSVYDTHPSILERETAAIMSAAPPGQEDHRPAAVLCDDIDALECLVLASYYEEVDVSKLHKLDWDCVAMEVYLPMWRDHVTKYGSSLEGVTIGDMYGHCARPENLIPGGRKPDGNLITLAARRGDGYSLLLWAFTLALINAGWELHLGMGECFLSHEGQVLDPPEVLGSLRKGKIDRVQWEGMCEAMGIGSVNLTG